MSVRVRTRKGNYYFATYKEAEDHAVSHGLPTERIIEYQIGWAIQLRKGGLYWGPEGWS